jgi:2,3-bisphosphoglycerate-dependent phosphoglycerate mutase
VVKLILMRHGESQWNFFNLFTGWVDIPLSIEGIEESLEGGRRIQKEPIDRIFTSTLIRAQMTAMLAMSVHESNKVPVILHPGEGNLEEWGKIYNPSAASQTIPVICAWELNERMYGELQGVNKKELAERYGAAQVQIWRRSFDIPPPGGESLAMTAARSIPYFEQQIVPYLEQGQNIFIAAHGNSLRSIIMKLDRLSPEEVIHLELKTGIPIIYTYDNGQFKKQT